MSAAAVALITASATAAAAAPSVPRPQVAIFATRAAPDDPGNLRDDFRAAFSRVLEGSARRGFAERRWRIVDAETGARAVSAIDADCLPEACLARAARRLSASRWVSSELAGDPAGFCEAKVSLHASDGRELMTRRGRAAPCTIDALAVRADALGRSVSAGPRWHPQAPATLSSTPLPDLHVRSLPDIPAPELTATTTAARRFPLDQSLEAFRERSVVIFRDDAGRLRFARRGRLIGECGLRRAVSAPLSREQRVFCRGNGWIWGLVGIPAGGLLAAASLPELEQGNLQGFVGVGLGLISSVTAAALAIGLSRFGHAPERGEYLSDPEELRRLAERGNRQLRRELGLTELEAGLSRAGSAPD